jgi:hypothetical protein
VDDHEAEYKFGTGLNPRCRICERHIDRAGLDQDGGRWVHRYYGDKDDNE